MNRLSKLLVSLPTCLIVILSFGVSIGYCGNSVGDLNKAAEQGDAEAQYHLGRAYHYGDGVPKNDVEAVRWTRKAAEQGHVKAQSNLGVAYYWGKGVPKDFVEAVKWTRKAAEQGNPISP